MNDLLISLHVPRDLAPGIVNLFIWALCVTLGLVGLFIMRLYLRGKMKKELMAREAMAMSMMDIDAMRKRGLVSDAEYKAIRHALAEREVEKERRRKQAEREKAILAQAAEDPEAARQLLATPPAEPAAKGNGRMAHVEPPPQPQAQPRPGAQDTDQAHPVARPGPQAAPQRQAQPQPGTPAKPAPARAAMDDLEREQARIFELSSADMVLPELLKQPAAPQPAQPKPAARPVAQQSVPRPSAPTPAPQPAPRPAQAAPQPTQATRPVAPQAAPRAAQPGQARPATPAPMPQAAPRQVAAQQPASRPGQPATARTVPANAPRAAAPAGAGAGKPASDLDLLLQKGAITPEEYQRLKAFVQ